MDTLYNIIAPITPFANCGLRFAFAALTFKYSESLHNKYATIDKNKIAMRENIKQHLGPANKIISTISLKRIMKNLQKFEFFTGIFRKVCMFKTGA
jgi:hypothetical protein